MKAMALGAEGKLTTRKRTNVTKKKRHVGVKPDIDGLIILAFWKRANAMPEKDRAKA
jgi:hypothetical protein